MNLVTLPNYKIYDGKKLYYNETIYDIIPENIKITLPLLSLKDILTPPTKDDKLFSVFISGMVDPEYIIESIKKETDTKNLNHILCVCHNAEPFIKLIPLEKGKTTKCIIYAPILSNGYSCMHTKLFIFAYTHYMRIVISSANYTSVDFDHLRQTFWIQDFPKIDPNLHNNNAYKAKCKNNHFTNAMRRHIFYMLKYIKYQKYLSYYTRLFDFKYREGYSEPMYDLSENNIFIRVVQSHPIILNNNVPDFDGKMEQEIKKISADLEIEGVEYNGMNDLIKQSAEIYNKNNSKSNEVYVTRFEYTTSSMFQKYNPKLFLAWKNIFKKHGFIIDDLKDVLKIVYPNDKFIKSMEENGCKDATNWANYCLFGSIIPQLNYNSEPHHANFLTNCIVHAKVIKIKLTDYNAAKEKSIVYTGSANLSASAWGNSFNEPNNFELGIVIDANIYFNEDKWFYPDYEIIND